MPEVKLDIAGNPMQGEWPDEIEFTDLYPSFYLEKLQNGADWEKELSNARLSNGYGNNQLMRDLKAYPNSMEIMSKAYKEFHEKGKPCHLNNILALLGDTTYTSLGPYLDGSKGGGEPLENTAPPVNLEEAQRFVTG